MWIENEYKSHIRKMLWHKVKFIVKRLEDKWNGVKSSNIFLCLKPECTGYIKNAHCDTCSQKYCTHCINFYEAKHICNPLVKKCPNCNVLILKDGGCDQMFCTRCHTTFFWSTGIIKRSGFHPGIEISWIEDDRHDRCEDYYISYVNMVSYFTLKENQEIIEIKKKLPRVDNVEKELPTISHYLLAFQNLQINILEVRSTSGNHANITEEYRKVFSDNLFHNKVIRDKITRIHFTYLRSMEYAEIYMLVYNVSCVLFRNIVSFRASRKSPAKEYAYFHKIYLQFMFILEHANKHIDLLNSVYGVDPRFVKFNRHPFNIKKSREIPGNSCGNVFSLWDAAEE